MTAPSRGDKRTAPPLFVMTLCVRGPAGDWEPDDNAVESVVFRLLYPLHSESIWENAGDTQGTRLSSEYPRFVRDLNLSFCMGFEVCRGYCVTQRARARTADDGSARAQAYDEARR